MDIFNKDELKNEESFGDFEYQGEADDSFSINGKEKYPDEISPQEIEQNIYPVFADSINISDNIQESTLDNFQENINDVNENNTNLEFESSADNVDNQNTIENNSIIENEDSQDVFDNFENINQEIDLNDSLNENLQSDLDNSDSVINESNIGSIEENKIENINIDNLTNDNINENNDSINQIETEVNQNELVAEKEFVDIEKSADAVEIDLDNLFPDHPSHFGIEEKMPDQEVIPEIAITGKKKKRLKKEKKEKVIKEKIVKEKVVKEKNKRKILPFIIPVAAACLLFMLITFADYKFAILDNKLNNALGLYADSTRSNKNDLAKKEELKKREQIIKANNKKKAEIENEWKLKEQKLDSIKKLEDLKAPEIDNTITSNKVNNNQAKYNSNIKSDNNNNTLNIEKQKQDKEKLLTNEIKKKNLPNNDKRVENKVNNSELSLNNKRLEAKKKAEIEEKNRITKLKNLEQKKLSEQKRLKEEKQKEIVKNKTKTKEKREFASAPNKKSEAISTIPNINNTEEYVVQVYASPSRADAELWLSKVQKKVNSPVVISTQVIRDLTWYRVRFGKFKTRVDAEKAAQQLGFSQTWIDKIK